MKLEEYQKAAGRFDLFEATGNLTDVGFLEKVLGLAGEAGETADKIKKVIRDKGGRADDADRAAITKELGDVLWYLANVARYLDISLEEVAATNLKKLDSRRLRGKLHGAGDER